MNGEVTGEAHRIQQELGLCHVNYTYVAGEIIGDLAEQLRENMALITKVVEYLGATSSDDCQRYVAERNLERLVAEWRTLCEFTNGTIASMPHLLYATITI